MSQKAVLLRNPHKCQNWLLMTENEIIVSFCLLLEQGSELQVAQSPALRLQIRMTTSVKRRTPKRANDVLKEQQED